MAKTRSRNIFVCNSCGAQSPKWQGRCNECGEWNTLQEEVVVQDKGRGWVSKEATSSEVVALNTSEKSDAQPFQRISTGISEFDRTLGGGVVPGSFILLGGDPGIGKSTLLLQMTKGIGDQNLKVLYVSGEESVQQTLMRARRLKTVSANTFIASESNLDVIIELTKKMEPDVLIVDSIQTVYLSELQSAPGTVSQVRECSHKLMNLAKSSGTAVFLIGHVTKDGHIAGPKTLEHMVDTVLSFEGDLHHHYRILRSLKNRFGTTNELGVFQMQSGGLQEVTNPSELFLEERSENPQGSAVLASMEGSRVILCEVQSLTTPSPLPMPRRNTIGFDLQRTHLILAVLDKHLDLHLANRDVFVNIVGGLKINEPAVDLAVAASLLSSDWNSDMDSKMCLFGEIGLTGEVRGVVQADQRIKEAYKLGFTKFIVPFANKKHVADLGPQLLKSVQFIKSVKELPRLLFPTGAMNRKPSKGREPAKSLDLEF